MGDFCHQLIVFPSHYDAHNELRVMFNLLSRFMYAMIANNVTNILVVLESEMTKKVFDAIEYVLVSLRVCNQI